MAFDENETARRWLDRLSGLNVEAKKMFGCYCLYCDGQAVGWLHEGVLSLREVGLDYLPDEIKRPGRGDKIQELVIPFDYANADWLPRAVMDTAEIRKKERKAAPKRKKQADNDMSSMENTPVDPAISRVFSRFFDGSPVSAEVIDTSRGEDDFRNTVIIATAEGRKYVLKLAANDFTFPDRISMWQRTVEEYRALGYYCPRIYCDKDGAFPIVEYKGRACAAYVEEFSKYRSLEDRAACAEDAPQADSSAYFNEIWSMTAKIAAKRLDYTEYPSAYCLFSTFCPSDETDEVLENALEWKKTAEALPAEFAPQVRRIWQKWSANREELMPLYAKLPTSVFQADLNSTNLLVDDAGGFKGVYDFNLCGREVFLNYLMRENSVETIPRALQTASEHYAFSDEEKAAALPLFRCLKPLWYSRVYELKEAGDDPEKIRRCLDLTERYLTDETDFAGYMG